MTHTPDHTDLPPVDLTADTSGGTATLTKDEVTEAMKDVVLDMTLTSAACPLTDVIMDQTEQALEGLVNDVTINWVWMPPWGPDKITDDGREMLRALGFNV